ncbi:hypothetical protein SASPL_135457 [Salvia splendens]|uniref:Uncharacterized protein n=1 Tax=Salvia splendens TaxID=180675 RepID=A0A8X8WY76_SALSN|nr:hypothetical protein SASPL_135457 [Salvia splendens]
MARGKELTAPATLVIQKELFRTDVSKNHNRLSIPASQISDGFLTEEERRRLRARRKGRVDATSSRLTDSRCRPLDAQRLQPLSMLELLEPSCSRRAGRSQAS